MAEEKILSMVLGLGFVGSLIALENMSKENFEQYPAYPQNKMFYQKEQAQANANFAMRNNMAQNVQSNNAYAGPIGGIPQNQANINLNSSGDQLLAYQLYQQATNASTPTADQLNAISGEGQYDANVDNGGVSPNFAPNNVLGGDGADLYNSEYQTVNMGNPRADAISACSQSSPTFVATSLLPKPSVPGQDSWDIGAPQDVLATQNFLSATQQMGVSTVLGSLRNASRDIRDNIPNPINVVSPFNQTTILPDLQRKSLCSNNMENGLYSPSNQNYVGTDYN